MRIVLGIFAFIAPVLAWSMIQQQDQQSGEGELLPDTLPPEGFLEGIGLMNGKSTRGERNNNPGNIRKSAANWQGKIPGSDSAFETFSTPAAGIRAMALLLKNYQLKYGLNTVRQIIGRWAPPNENNTESYIRGVSAALGVKPDDKIDLRNTATLATLVDSVIQHENGRNIYSSITVQGAVMTA